MGCMPPAFDAHVIKKCLGDKLKEIDILFIVRKRVKKSI